MVEILDIGRRDAFALIGGAAAVTIVASGGAAAAPGKAGNFDPLRDPLKTYLLMRGALDDRLVISSLQGQYLGVVDGDPTPLFGVVAATFARHRPRPGGGYDVASGELSWFTDLATGQPLDRWTNPYTKETVTVPRQGLPPSTFAMLPDMTFKLTRAFPGMAFDHHIQPAEIRGPDIWIPELTITAVTIPGKPAFHYSERTTLHARLADFTPGTRQVGSDTAFANIVSWRPFMNMGDRPGHMIAIGAGRYGATIETLPPALITALRGYRPELLTNPSLLIDPLWK